MVLQFTTILFYDLPCSEIVAVGALGAVRKGRGVVLNTTLLGRMEGIAPGWLEAAKRTGVGVVILKER